MAKRGRGRPRKVHSPDLAQNMPNSSNKKLTHPEFFKIYIPELASQVMLADNENASKGSPPASKSVVENLLSLVLTKEDVEENSSSVACAVCKDEFAVGEKVTKMPCSHLYHGECILPWLGIRNTCPVCRHELPTDDADYEKRKNGRIRSGSGGTVFDDFEVAEFANIRKQLEVLEDRLDSMVQPRLTDALNNKKANVAQEMRGILIRIGRFKSLESYYSKVHLKPIKKLWEDFDLKQQSTKIANEKMN